MSRALWFLLRVAAGIVGMLALTVGFFSLLPANTIHECWEAISSMAFGGAYTFFAINGPARGSEPAGG